MLYIFVRFLMPTKILKDFRLEVFYWLNKKLPLSQKLCYFRGAVSFNSLYFQQLSSPLLVTNISSYKYIHLYYFNKFFFFRFQAAAADSEVAVVDVIVMEVDSVEVVVVTGVVVEVWVVVVAAVPGKGIGFAQISKY